MAWVGEGWLAATAMPPKGRKAPSGKEKKDGAVKSPEKASRPRTIRIHGDRLPQLRDARQLRVCCGHLPPRLPTSQFSDPLVVLEVAASEDAPFRRLGTTEILDPWLSEKDEELAQLQAQGVDFGDMISVRHENDEQWTNAAFKQRVPVAWRANSTARLRLRLYYLDAENGPSIGDEGLLDAADLIAEAICPLDTVIRQGKRAQSGPTVLPLQQVEGGHEVAMETLDGTRSTVTIHAEPEEEAAKGGLQLNPFCVVWAAKEGEELQEIGKTEEVKDAEARLDPRWTEEVVFPMDSTRLRFVVYCDVVAGAGARWGPTAPWGPGPMAADGLDPEFVGQADVLTADLLAADEVRLDLELKTRGLDTDAVRPFDLATSSLHVDGQVHQYRDFRGKKKEPTPVSIMQLLDADGDGVVTQFEYQAFMERQKEYGRETVIDDMKLYRAVRDATVRSGCELSTPKIDVIEINTIVEALEVKNERGGGKRIRCSEGWVSAKTQKGQPLMQCLGEARLEREAEVKRREEAMVEQARAEQRQKYAERAMRVKLMGLVAEKLKAEAKERDAFEMANLKKMMAVKRAEEEEERRRQEEIEKRRQAMKALEDAKEAEKVRVESLLHAAGVDVGQQEERLGEPLTLSSQEYACARMLQVLSMVRKPISDGVKNAMKLHRWPGSTWKKNAHSLWFDYCRSAGNFVLSQDSAWPTTTCLVIISKHIDVIMEAAPDDIQADDDGKHKLQQTMHHVGLLGRFWYWVVSGNTVEAEIIQGITALAHLLHVLNAPEAVALHRLIEDLKEIGTLQKSVQSLDKLKIQKLDETKSHRKVLREAFRAIDTDNSGDIDRDELAQVVTKLGHSDDLSTILADMDENSDGSISFDEFSGWWQMSACSERIATSIDEDDSDFVAIDELVAFFERANKLEGDIQPDPQAEAKRIVSSNGDGEFVHVAELSKALLRLYRRDHALLNRIEDELYTAPDALSRGLPAVFCAAMRLLQAMLALQTELVPILEATREFQPAIARFKNLEDDEIGLDLKACCELLKTQLGRADLQKAPGILAMLTSGNFDRLIMLCKYVLEHEEKLLHAAEHGWDFIARATQDVYAVIGFFKEAHTEAITKCRDSVLGLRDLATVKGGSDFVVAMLGHSVSEGVLDVTVDQEKVFGREAIVSEISEAVLETGSMVLVYGEAGIGKTCVLRECATKLSLRFDIYYMLDGLTEVSLYEGFLKLGRQHVDSIPSDAPLESAVVDQVVDFLRKEEEWLLIIDNAVDANKVVKLIPEGVGHVLLATTRIDRWEPHQERLTDLRQIERPETPVLLQIMSSVVAEEHQDQLKHERLTEMLENDLAGLPLMAKQLGMLVESGISMEDIWQRVSAQQALAADGRGLVTEGANVAIDLIAEPGVYEVTVKTAGVKGAGTDANVFLQMLGELEGEPTMSTIFPLDHSTHSKSHHEHRNKFEFGQKDEFVLRVPEGTPLGDITRLKISHDGHGFGASWYIDFVRIAHPATNEVWHFTDGGWLSKEKAEVGERRFVCVAATPIMEEKLENEGTKKERLVTKKVGMLMPGDQINVVEEPFEVDTAKEGKQPKVSTRVRSPSLPNPDCWVELSGPPPNVVVQKLNALRGLKKADAAEKREGADDSDEPMEEASENGPVVYMEEHGLSLQMVEIESLGGKKHILREMSVIDLKAGNLTEYDLIITTGDVPGAGTDAQVFVTIYGSRGDSGKLMLDQRDDLLGRDDFERGRTDTFTVFAPNVGKVTKLKIWHDSTGPFAGWYLDDVGLVDKSCWKQWEFPCYQWLDRGQGDGLTCRELLPGTMDAGANAGYQVKVKTGDLEGAGTDSKVYINIIGSKGPSGEKHLDNPHKNDFERGNEDVFDVSCAEIGRPEKIRVWHSNSGFGAAWYLEKITLVCKKTWKQYVFPCDMWFDKRHTKNKGGDGLIDRLLDVDKTQTVAIVPYQITIKTGDRLGAGTDANVFIQLFGSEGPQKNNEEDIPAGTGERLLDAPGDEFEKGQTDLFVIESPELGSLNEMRLWHDNTGLGPGWYVDEVTVTNKLTLKEWLFPVHRWFSTTEDDGEIDRVFQVSEERVVQLVRYTITTITGDRKGAGTDAHVWVHLYSEHMDSGPHFLVDKDGKDTFERGQHDSFVVEIADIGTLKRIRIGHDGSGIGSAWYLHRVIVTNESTNDTYIFPAYTDSTERDGTWLDTKDYDGVSKDKLEVEIEAILQLDMDGQPKRHAEAEQLRAGVQVVSDMIVEALEKRLVAHLVARVEMLENRKAAAIQRGDFDENKAIAKEIKATELQMPGVAVQPRNLLYALATMQDAMIPYLLFDDPSANGAPESKEQALDAVLINPALANFWDTETFERNKVTLLKMGIVSSDSGVLIMHGLLQRCLRVSLADKVDKSVPRAVTQILKNRVIQKVGNQKSWARVLPMLGLTRAFYRRDDCPMVESAECSWAIGRMLEEHGFLEDAKPMYEYALFGYRHELGNLHPRTCTVYNNLGNLYELVAETGGNAEDRAEWFKRAKDMYRHALDITEQLLGSEHAYISTCCMNLGGMHKRLHEDVEALPLFRRALFLREKEDPRSAATATSLHALGMLYQDMDNHSGALEVLTQCLDIRKEKLGFDHPDTTMTRQTLVATYEAKFMYAEVIPLLEEHIDLFGPNPMLLNNLGFCNESIGNVDRAITFYIRTMDAATEVYGPRHPLVGVAAYRLGVMYYSKAEYERSLPMYELALEITGEYVDDVATSLFNIGSIYLSIGMHDKAEPPLREALRMRKEKADNQAAEKKRALGEAKNSKFRAAGRRLLIANAFAPKGTEPVIGTDNAVNDDRDAAAAAAEVDGNRTVEDSAAPAPAPAPDPSPAPDPDPEPAPDPAAGDSKNDSNDVDPSLENHNDPPADGTRASLSYELSPVALKDTEVLECLWQITLLLIATCEGDADRQEETLGCLRIIISHRRTELGIEHEDFTAAMSLLEVLYNIMLRQANNTDQAMVEALKPLPTIEDAPRPNGLFSDGTGFYSTDNPPPVKIAIGPRSYESHSLTTKRLLTLVFNAIDIDSSGSCTNAEIFNSKFGKVLHDGLWTGYSSSAFAEWTSLDANNDGVAELAEWLDFFHNIQLEMECDDAAFKSFLVSVVDRAWPEPEAIEHVRAVRMLKYLYDQIDVQGQGMCSKSDLAASALGRVLNKPLAAPQLDALPLEASQRVQPSSTSRVFGDWILLERKCNGDVEPDEQAIFCSSCKRCLAVGGENGWWHDRGSTRDQCEKDYRRKVREEEVKMVGASPMGNYVAVEDKAQIGVIMGDDLPKYARGTAELPEFLSLFAEIQKDMELDDQAFEEFVRELMQRIGPDVLSTYLAQLPPEPPPEPEPVDATVNDVMQELLLAVEERVADELLAIAQLPPPPATEEQTEAAVGSKEVADKLMQEGQFAAAAEAYGAAMLAFPENTALSKLKMLAERKASTQQQEQQNLTAQKNDAGQAQHTADPIEKVAEQHGSLITPVQVRSGSSDNTTEAPVSQSSFFQKAQQMTVSASKDVVDTSKDDSIEPPPDSTPREPGTSTAIAISEKTEPITPSKGLGLASLLSAKKAAAAAKKARKAAAELEKKALSRRQYQEISRLYQVVGDEEAMVLCQRAYDLAVRMFGEDHPRSATGANNLGMLHLQRAGDGSFDERAKAYELARPLLEKAMVLRINLNGETDPDTAATTHALGWLIFEAAMLVGSDDQAEFDEAAELLKTAGQVRCHLLEIETWPPSAEDLLGLKTTTLQERCTVEGIAPEDIQKAMESDDPRERLIWVLLEKLAPMDAASGEDPAAQASRRMKVKRQMEGVPPAEKDLLMEAMLSISCLASVYYTQKKYTEARPILEVALELRMRNLGPHHIDTAETMNSLGMLLSKTARGQPVEGSSDTSRSPRLRLPRLGKKHVLAQEAEAERLLKGSLGVRKRYLGEKHVEVSNTIFELIQIAVRQDRKGEAIPLLEECLDIRAEALGENHPYTEETLVLLSKLREEAAMRDDTQWALCVPLYERILALRESQGMEDRIDTMEVLDALAGCLKESGREPEAIQYWERALAMTERMFPHDAKHPHPRTASLLNNLAVAHRQAGRDDKALELWRKDLAICEATVGSNHPDTAVTLNNLAGIHKKRGMRVDRNESPQEYDARMAELHAAKKMYGRALSIRSKVLPPQDPRLALTMHSLAAVYKEMRELKKALPLLQSAVEIQAASLGPDHPETMATKKHLVQLYNRLKPKTVTIR